MAQRTGMSTERRMIKKLAAWFKKHRKELEPFKGREKKEKKPEKKPERKFEDLPYWEKRKFWNTPRGKNYQLLGDKKGAGSKKGGKLKLMHGGKAKKKYGVVGKPTLRKGGKA